jgi:hypothetical protein
MFWKVSFAHTLGLIKFSKASIPLFIKSALRLTLTGLWLAEAPGATFSKVHSAR